MKQLYILLISIALFSQATSQTTLSQTNLLDLDAEGFYPNKGQILDISEQYNEEVTYMNYGREMNIQLRKNGFSYERFVCYGRKDTTHQPFEKFLPQRSKILDEKVIYDRIDIDIEGMNTDVKMEAVEMSSDYMHYNIEEQGIEKKINVNRYRKVIYKNVYTGIDLEFVMNQGQFKFNWILEPGADLNQIKLTYHNAQKLTLTQENTLLIKTHLGILEESLPASYWVSTQPQIIDELNAPVKVRYHLNGNTIRYEMASPKLAQKLVIDPTVTYQWGTYVNTFVDSNLTNVSSYWQYFSGGIVDEAGNSYVVGKCAGHFGFATRGISWDTSTYFDATIIGKFNSNGQKLWGCFFGSMGSVDVNQFKVDNDNNIWCSGTTNATKGIVNKGSYIDTQITKYCNAGYISKLDTGGNLLGGTYLSIQLGSGTYAYDFAFDSKSNILVTGTTTGDTAMATVGTHMPKRTKQNEDVFIQKFTPQFQRIWGTYYGGYSAMGTDIAYGITLDENDNIFIAGYTNNDSGIITPDCYKCSRLYNQDGEGFFAKFSPTGQLLYGSFYGSDGSDALGRIFIDKNNNLVMSGVIDGAGMSTSGAFDTAFVTGTGTPHIVVFDSLMHRKCATNIAGAGKCWDIEEKDGDYILAGQAEVTALGRKITNAQSPFEKRSYYADGFIVRISPELDSLRWGTYIGGRSQDVINQIAIHGQDIYAFGTTGSANRIGTAGTYRPVNPDSFNIIGFVSKVNDCSPALMVSNTQHICIGESITLTATGANSYFWQPSNSNQSQIQVSPTQNTVYAITGSDNANCSITKTVKVYVSTKPNISLEVMGRPTFCAGDSVALRAKFSDSIHIDWKLDGQPFAGKNDTLRYAKASGIYSIAGGQMAGCVAQVNQQVWASALPKPQIIIVGDSLKCSTSASAYQWYMFGVKIPKATTQSFLPDNKGKFKVVITDSIGCETVSDEFVYTGISNIASPLGIKIYPNPIKTGEPLYIENEHQEIKSIQLIDLSGRVLQTPTLNASRIYTLNQQSTGIYILKIVTRENQWMNVKLVVTE